MSGTATVKRNDAPAGGATRSAIASLNSVITDLETLRAALGGANTLINQLRYAALYNTMGNPGFQIRSNFDVQNATAFFYTNGGTLKTMAATQAWDTGTTKTVTANLFMAALLTVTSGAANVVTYAATAGYASEALAIAALPAAPNATDTVVGYFTFQAGASLWTAGTDALASGTGGTPAAATTYYNSINPNSAQIGAALTTTTVDTAADLVAWQVKDAEGTVIADDAR